MQETQTGMAPFFKTNGCFTLTLTMTNWAVPSSHHPILRPSPQRPNIRVIQTDPKHSQTHKGPRIVCDQSLFWLVNIGGQCLFMPTSLFWLVINTFLVNVGDQSGCSHQIELTPWQM
jgi:hypothetical protein